MEYKYKIEKALCWYNKATQIVLMYFIEGIPFTFDELEPDCILDPEIVSKANNQLKWEPEDLYLKSFYLIDEQVHPCLFPVNLENPEDLPDEYMPL